MRHALGGNVSIEDLLIPFFCISTNLSQLDQEVHHHIYHRKLVSVVSQCDSCSQVHENGKLWPAVRASMTVVGLMPPMSRFHSLSLSAFLASHHPFLQGGRPAGGRRVHGQPSSSTDGAWLFRVTHLILPTSLTILAKVRMKPRHGIGCIIASDVERRNNNSLREVRHIVDLLAPQAPVVSDQFLCL